MKQLINSFIAFIMLAGITGCSGSTSSESDQKEDSAEVDTFDLCDHRQNVVLYLQPFDNFTQKEAKNSVSSIREGLLKIFPNYTWDIRVLPNKPLPKDAFYAENNRYRADKLLKHLYTKDGFLMGLTHKDISWTIHGAKDYGIMGLTPIGSNKSIVSDYRAKGNNLIGVIVHEFLHGFSGAPHCKNSDCIMCDHQCLKGKKRKFKLCEDHWYINPHL